MSDEKLFKYIYRSGSALYAKDAESRPRKIDILAPAGAGCWRG